jgi:putative methionine-R-sulfoxide reductase with GAF domain
MGDNGPMVKAYPQIVAASEEFATTAPDACSVQEFSVQLIAQRLPHYNWIGFYMLDPQDPAFLVLGPFHGAPTKHVRIPVSEGICGAAVAQGETVIVDDVTADPRYFGLFDRNPVGDCCPNPCKGSNRRGDRHRQSRFERLW